MAERDAARRDEGGIGDLIQTVKDYARQETLGPLRGAGRWLAFGAIGAVLLGFATLLLVLGVLRLLQNEMAPTFRGRWMSLVPYAIAVATAFVVIVVTATRIGKSTLNKETGDG